MGQRSWEPPGRPADETVYVVSFTPELISEVAVGANGTPQQSEPCALKCLGPIEATIVLTQRLRMARTHFLRALGVRSPRRVFLG